MTLIATAPGKLMLAGEYAVLDGGPALIIAVSRRVRARLLAENLTPPPLSEFITGIASLFEQQGQPLLAAATRRIVVDSSSFYLGRQKLGLGSSAAVTVATIACVIGNLLGVDAARPDRIVEFAEQAHGNVQGARGARGSGADLVTCAHGGLVRFVRGGTPAVQQYSGLPDGTQLVAFFTGQSADTAQLVAGVRAAQQHDPGGVNRALAAIAAAATQAAIAVALNQSSEFIAALQQNAVGLAALGQAAKLELETEAVRKVRSAVNRTDVCVKTTGAGGGDIAIVVGPATLDVTETTQRIIQAGCNVIPLSLTSRGVDFEPSAG